MTQHDWRAPGPRDWKCEYNLTGTAVHLRPRNDLTWHTLDDDCPCGPTTTHPDTTTAVRWIHIHHALDGRHTPPAGHYTPEPGPTDPHDGECDGIAA